MNYEELLEVYKKVTDLNEDEKLILESIRFRDEDQSVKSGAILAFSGLMIATSFVQLSVEIDSLLYISKESPLIYLNIVGLVCLFLASFISLTGMTISGKYSSTSRKALLQFNLLVNRRAKLLTYSIVFSAVGSLLTLLSFFGSLF